MTLREIRKVLANRRQNGLYFRHPKWEKGVYGYVSKKGSLYFIYSMIAGMNAVTSYSPDMENMLNADKDLEIWEGSV